MRIDVRGVIAAAMFGCGSSTTTAAPDAGATDDASVDASSDVASATDAGSDGGTDAASDAGLPEVDAGSSFCASHLSSLFCADFDEGRVDIAWAIGAPPKSVSASGGTGATTDADTATYPVALSDVPTPSPPSGVASICASGALSAASLALASLAVPESWHAARFG